MAEIISRPINSGDPVTAEIINNLVLDLNELNKTTAGSFSLTLASTGEKQGGAVISQKIYSTVIRKKVSDKSTVGGTWNFAKDNIKFNNIPRCWIQLQNTNTSLAYTKFDFKIVITSVSTTSMTFQIRGNNFPSDTHDFVCFAAEA